MSQVTQISKEAKGIFAAILKQLGEDQHLKIDVNNYNPNEGGLMPLTVERLETDLQTTWGTGYEVSFCHYYESNGDLMQDPEMTFIVVDNRKGNEGNFDMLGIWPASIQQSGMFARHQVAMRFEGGKTFVNMRLQKELAVFANQWLKNIKFQQNIKPVKANPPVSFFG